MTGEFLLFVSAFFFLLAIGVPIAFCMGLASLLYLLVAETANLSIIFGRMAGSMQSYLYAAVAFFVLASALMNNFGITQRIYDFAHSLVGHIRGGLAQVNVLGSIIFSGMTGTALGDAAGLGRVEIHAMREAGYRPAYAGAVSIASAVIGPIIPPSFMMIIYAELAEVSVARLFLGGVVPGLLIGVALMIHVYFTIAGNGPERFPRASWTERLTAFRRAFWALMAPIIVVGGMVFGIVTPTEAAALAAVYALVLGVAYRELTLAEMMSAVREAVIGTATPLFVVSTAMLFSWIVTIEQVPEGLIAVLGDLVSNWWFTVLFLNVLLLIMGCVLEGLGIMILMVPVLKPIAEAAGIDLVHLGVFMVVNLMIGTVTPPVGVLLYVACDITRCSLNEIVRAVLPFLVPLVAGLLITAFVPATVLWLPALLLD
jgi:tripartite ATP-independent transporter DctM subunit